MGLFGGVQVVSILCSILRAKLVAMWIGPVGVGLMSIWNMTVETISSATQLGLRDSAVRLLAADSNQSARARIAIAIRRWGLWLGLGGALITILLAPALSTALFGDSEHIWGFVALSAAVLMLAMVSGEQAILQGSQQLKNLAKAQVVGVVAGVAASAPLFYWLGEEGVLYSVIICAVLTAVSFLIFRNKHISSGISHEPMRASLAYGKQIVSLGVAMTVGAFTMTLGQYVLVAFINKVSGTYEVGLYQAGFTIVNKYSSLMLGALAVEYYPRLASVSHSNRRLSTFVSHQMLLTLCVALPTVLVFIPLRGIVIDLLYSTDFQAAQGYVAWALAGTMLRATSWCMAFSILARGDARTFIVTEVSSMVIGIASGIGGYLLFGLTGLGIAYVVWYLAYNVIIGAVYFGKYRLSLARRPLWLGIIATVAAIAVAWLVA